MPSEEETLLPEPRLPGAYLLSLLASGARPFSYRSGAYRLLGAAPPAEPSMAFLPPVPPVGFRYARHRRPDFRSEAPPALSPEASFVRPSEEAPVEEQHGVREEETSSEAHTPMAFSARPRRPGAAEPSAARSAPSAPPRLEPRATLEKEQKQVSEAAPPRALPKGVAPAASAAPMAPASGDPAPSAPAPPPGAPLVEPPPEPPSERPVGLAIPGLTRRRSPFAPLMAALQDDAAPPASALTPPPLSPPPFIAPAGRPDAVEAPAQPERSEAVSAPPPPRPDGAARVSALREAAAPGFQPGAPRDAAVERVRRATAASRPAPAPAQGAPRAEPSRAPAPSASARPAPAPPALQPVVVVRQAPGRNGRRAPRAFWASSVLRSTHLRMLR